MIQPIPLKKVSNFYMGSQEGPEKLHFLGTFSLLKGKVKFCGGLFSGPLSPEKNEKKEREGPVETLKTDGNGKNGGHFFISQC